MHLNAWLCVREISHHPFSKARARGKREFVEYLTLKTEYPEALGSTGNRAHAEAEIHEWWPLCRDRLQPHFEIDQGSHELNDVVILRTCPTNVPRGE
jgi:hypothetical protein